MGLEKLFDFFLSIIELFYFTVVVDGYQEGVILRFGKYHRTIGPGIHFILPFSIERIVEVNVCDRTRNLGKQGLTTSDGKSIAITAIVTYCIRDSKKAVMSVEGPVDALEDICYSNIGSCVRRATWEQVCEADFENVLLRECRKNAFKYGMEISKVQLADCTLARAYNLYMQENS